MDEQAIRDYVANKFAGVDIQIGDEGIAAGDTFFIYDPDRKFEGAQRMPFATIVTKDYGDYDNASNLNRPGVYRLNIGVTRASFVSLLGSPSPEPTDFAALDRLMPHPIYGQQWWISVISPSETTFEHLKPFLAEAYELVVKRRSRAGSC